MRIVLLLGVILLAVVLLGKKIPLGFIPEEKHLWHQGLHGLQQLWRLGDARHKEKK